MKDYHACLIFIALIILALVNHSWSFLAYGLITMALVDWVLDSIRIGR